MRKTILFLLGSLFILSIVFLTNPFGASSAAGDKRSKKVPAVSELRGPANFDALADSQPRAEASRQQAIEGGRAVQTEPRFDVPTFLWASDPGEARPMRRGTAERRADQISAARSHLSKYADRYRLSKTDIMTARVAQVHDTGTGAIVVKLQQDLGGVEVFRDEINIVMNRDLQLVSISGYLTGDHTSDTSPARNFSLQPEDALSRSFTDLTGKDTGAGAFERIANPMVKGRLTLMKENDPYTHFRADSSSLDGFVLTEEPARTKPVMFHLPSGYIPAYYVEAAVYVHSDDVLDISGQPRSDELAYGYVISAVDGQVLLRKNLIAEQFTYRVWADPTTKIPYDTPAGNNVHPKIDAVPDGVQYPFAAQQDVTLLNFPFSMNDPWIAPGATDTQGNNADAFVDLTTPDGYGPIAGAPYGGAGTGDFRAQITAAGQFLHSHTPDADPATAEARQSSIQQLFYNINFLHDWFYDAGFNEVSGNAQTDNYTRGGLANDNIKAQAQDFAARNNANMLTPADGGRPRMRMYLFDTNAVKYVDVLTPPAAAGQRGVGTGQFGQQVFDLTNQLVQPTTPAGCLAGDYTGTAGKFVMVDRQPTSGAGSCSIGVKLGNAMTAGAAGFILVNLSTTPDQVVNVTGSLPTFTIPFLSISWNGAAAIKTQLAVPNVVTARMRRDAGVDRDGTLDNQIVAHEWGHYISNRLIGNGSGLVSNNSGGLGEGWGDTTSMLLTVRADDTSVPSNSTWNGAYAMATYATSGGVNNGYYYGIRRMPYSTDFAINNLTYRHIANGQTIPAGPPIAFGADGSNNAEVHNIGEVWAEMLWECYASLLRDTQGPTPRIADFATAQTRFKNYLVAAYKITPYSPTLLEARDAVLAAAFAGDYQDGVRFGQAFAKRGAGIRAVAPTDRFSGTNAGVAEDYTAGADITFVSAVLDDSVVTVDNDGYLDSGETGNLTITLKNSGTATLAATSSVVSSSNPGISYPNGSTVNFPAVQPYTTSTITIQVHSLNQVGLQQTEFTITSNDPSRPGSTQLIPTPVAGTYRTYTNADLIPAASATDNVEANITPWTISSNPSFAQGAGDKFRRQAPALPINYKWFVPDMHYISDQRLTSPVFTVDGSGSFNLQFDHSWGFEFDGGGNYDGGVVESSINGGAFADISTAAYNGTILNQGAAAQPLSGRLGFVQNSAGTVHTSLTQAIAPGSTVQVRFRAASDAGVGAAGWNIDNIAFTGVVETPFAVLFGEFAPTAASVSVGGRVTTAFGQGMPRVAVSITGSDGTTVRATTNAFGYYRFDNVVSGQSYTIQASAKRYRFTPRIVTVMGELTDVDITPNESDVGRSK